MCPCLLQGVKNAKRICFRICWYRDKMKQTKSISKMREDKLTPKLTVLAFKKVR